MVRETANYTQSSLTLETSILASIKFFLFNGSDKVILQQMFCGNNTREKV